MRTLKYIKETFVLSFAKISTFVTTLGLALAFPQLAFAFDANPTVVVQESNLGFTIPNFADILTFMIRAFFVAAGVFALLYLLLGAFAWITSGGNKEGVEKARDKIQAAIVGVILIVIVVALVATLENIVFGRNLCFGLTCPVSIPHLLKPPGS